MKKIIEKTELTPMESCPKFLYCSAPLCPLDIDYGKRCYIKDESQCTLRKATRKQLGKDLLKKGLFPKEYSALIRWKSRSNEDKDSFIKTAKEALSEVRQTHVRNGV